MHKIKRANKTALNRRKQSATKKAQVTPANIGQAIRDQCIPKTGIFNTGNTQVQENIQLSKKNLKNR